MLDRTKKRGKRCLRCGNRRGVQTMAVPVTWGPASPWPVLLCRDCAADQDGTLAWLSSLVARTAGSPCQRCGGPAAFVLGGWAGDSRLSVAVCEGCFADVPGTATFLADVLTGVAASWN
jgi:hypothetical protein